MIFDHRVAVITGAAGRIGRALCDVFGSQGVALALFDLDGERLRTLAGQLVARGIRASAFQVDVTDSAAVSKAASDVLKEFGKVDILVNNAGVWPRCPFAEMYEELWSKVMDINLNSVFRVTKAFLPSMLQHQYGRIINLGSIAGEAGLPAYSAYSTAKAAVIMLTKNLVMELARSGITVNCVSPGMIADESTANSGTWVGRSGTGDEVARPIAFLASDDSGYITGHDLTVDGGRILGPHNANF